VTDVDIRMIRVTDVDIRMRFVCMMLILGCDSCD
jgi:hypothetical protein